MKLNPVQPLILQTRAIRKDCWAISCEERSSGARRTSKAVRRAVTRLTVTYGPETGRALICAIGESAIDHNGLDEETGDNLIDGNDLQRMVIDAAKLSRGRQFTADQIKRLMLRRVEMHVALPIRRTGVTAHG